MGYLDSLVAEKEQTEICLKLVSAEIKGERLNRRRLREYFKSRKLALKRLEQLYGIGELIGDKITTSVAAKSLISMLKQEAVVPLKLSLLPKSPLKFLVEKTYDDLSLSSKLESAEERSTKVFSYLKPQLERKCLINKAKQADLKRRIRRIVEAYDKVLDPEQKLMRKVVREVSQRRLPGSR